MFVCKHCNKEFNSLSRANKANHSRWCLANPKRITYTETLSLIRQNITTESRKIQAAKISCLHKKGQYIDAPLKGKITKIINGTNAHTKKTKQLLREKALASPHRRLKKKMIQYNGIWLDSTWELELAKRLDTLQIKWVRPEPVKWVDDNNLSHNYFPDFYLPDYKLYLDPKNPQAYRVQKNKIETLLKQYTNLRIIKTLEDCKNFNI